MEIIKINELVKQKIIKATEENPEMGINLSLNEAFEVVGQLDRLSQEVAPEPEIEPQKYVCVKCGTLHSVKVTIKDLGNLVPLVPCSSCKRLTPIMDKLKA